MDSIWFTNLIAQEISFKALFKLNPTQRPEFSKSEFFEFLRDQL